MSVTTPQSYANQDDLSTNEFAESVAVATVKHRSGGWNRIGASPISPPSRHYSSHPYKGLLFFNPEDADLLYGWETLTAHLVKRVTQLERSSASRFQAVVGASGRRLPLRFEISVPDRVGRQLHGPRVGGGAGSIDRRRCSTHRHQWCQCRWWRRPARTCRATPSRAACGVSGLPPAWLDVGTQDLFHGVGIHTDCPTRLW